MLSFVFGGAHQGKWAFVKRELLKEKTFYLDGHDAELDFDWPEGEGALVFNCFHHWVKRQLAVDRDPILATQDLLVQAQGLELIIVCDDISCGIVSASPFDRRYRQILGQIMQSLSQEAELVIRLLCGIPEVIKDEKRIEE